MHTLKHTPTLFRMNEPEENNSSSSGGSGALPVCASPCSVYTLNTTQTITTQKTERTAETYAFYLLVSLSTKQEV